jgi:hypothetical protein
MNEMMQTSIFVWFIVICIYFGACVMNGSSDEDHHIDWWAWPGFIILSFIMIVVILCIVGFILYALTYPLIHWLTPIILPLITKQ